MRLAGLAAVVVAFLFVAPSVANADGYYTDGKDTVGASADGATSDVPKGDGGGQDGGRQERQPTYLPKDEYDKQMAAYKAAVAAAIRANQARSAAITNCLATGAGCVVAPGADIPGQPNIALAGDPAPPPPPPEVIAYQAVAELKLTAPKPVVGPPPEINRWKTAVVGYPLWLSTAGNPNPPAVSDSVYDVSVSLQAHLQRVVFDMGDGHKVTCTDTSHAWTRSVATNAKSPWCGYAYQEVPKHSKTYTITAYAVWSVDWQINGTTGTLPFYQQTSVDLPVSELQVLVR